MQQRTRDFIGNVSFLGFVAFFLFQAVTFDVFGAGDHHLVAGVVIALCGGPMVMSERFWRRRWKSWICVACWLVAVALFVTPWHPRKRFVARLDSLRSGMSVDEVETVLRPSISNVSPAEPTGAARDTYDGTLVYRWNDHDAEFDADDGFVEFAHGRVMHVEFMSD